MGCLAPLLTLLVEVDTRPEANDHSHWRGRSTRSRIANEVVFDALVLLSARPDVQRGLVVRMTRISPGHVDDDNAVTALKHVRDAIARWLGIDDRSPLVTWLCERSTEAGPMRAHIEVFARGAPAPGVIVADEATVLAVRELWQVVCDREPERAARVRAVLDRAGILGGKDG